MATPTSGSPSAESPSTAIDVESEVGRLYADHPARFTAARDELAKRLRAAGRKDEAASVKGLRRPTVAAWAVNRVARERSSDVARLREIGAKLRRAQERALQRRGDTADVLRDLGARRRAVIAELVDAAAAVLAAGDGVAPDSHRADIVGTFEAVAADDEAAASVAAARLSRPLGPPIGFGAPASDDDAEIVVLDDDANAGARRGATKNRAAPSGHVSGAVHILDAAEVRKARARAAKAREAVEAAEQEVTRLGSALTAARQELARAKAASARAEAAAGSADATATRGGSVP